MSTSMEKASPSDVGPRAGPPPGSVRRLGSAIGLATITVLDLLALDDITTAGAWLPEIGFIVASVPALVVLAYYTFRGSREPEGSSAAAHRRRLSSGTEGP